MLKCETNSKEVDESIMESALNDGVVSHHDNLNTNFELGQWWVSCSGCGADWSVCDCQKDGVDYFGFEEVSHGDESCFRDDKTENNCCLEGLKCPKCGSLAPFRMDVIQTVTMWDNGSDETSGDVEFNDATFCVCDECDFEGCVGDFYIDQSKRRKKNQDRERVNTIAMDDRELNQILAALRHWQYSLPDVAEMERYDEYLEDGLTFMSAEEIDELCERFNLGPLPDDSDHDNSDGICNCGDDSCFRPIEKPEDSDES